MGLSLCHAAERHALFVRGFRRRLPRTPDRRRDLLVSRTGLGPRRETDSGAVSHGCLDRFARIFAGLCTGRLGFGADPDHFAHLPMHGLRRRLGRIALVARHLLAERAARLVCDDSAARRAFGVDRRERSLRLFYLLSVAAGLFRLGLALSVLRRFRDQCRGAVCAAADRGGARISREVRSARTPGRAGR